MIGTAHALSHLMHECVQGIDDRRWLAASGEAIVMAQAQASGFGATGAGDQTGAMAPARARLAAEHFKWSGGGGTGCKSPLRDIGAYAGSMAAYTALAGALQERGSSQLQRTS